MDIKKVIVGDATLYCGDCMDIMPTLGEVDAVVTDPPYGIGMDGGNVGYKGENNFKKKSWDKKAPSLESILYLKKPTIIFGGNYFNLPPSRFWLLWDKGAGFKGRTYAEAEMAWCSFDGNTRIFTYDPLAKRDYRGKYHPTMKPVSVMKWCISHLPKNTETIVDPFMGSGTTGVACLQMGRKFVGIEKDPEYFEIACQRIQREHDQLKLF